MNTVTENTIKIEIGTGLLPVLDVGMYESHIDAKYVLESGLYELSDKAQNQFWDLYDNSAYESKIFEYAKRRFDSEITPILLSLNAGIETIEVMNIESPREYNFTSDKLSFDIVVNIDRIRELIIKENPKVLEAFLSETFKSYSGFCSFMPQTVIQLLVKLDSDAERAVSAFLTYLIRDKEEEFKEIQERFIDSINENFFYTEFIKEPKDKRTYRKLFTEINKQR